MHYCTFVIIGAKGDPDALVAGALAPFDEALAVTPYREYLQPFDIELMASHYSLDRNDLNALVERMKDWIDRPGCVDERALYFTTTSNPEGRWDRFEIGGRWSVMLKGARRNVISTRALRKSPKLKDVLPCYVLTPGGTRLEHERYIPDPHSVGHFETKSDEQWLAEVSGALEQYPNHRVVWVDIHC